MRAELKKQNKTRFALRYAILAIMAVAIGINIYWLNASRLTGNQVPMPFGYGASVVLSGSMEPEISVGDLILIREEDSYAVGDIVVYQSSGISVVHRVVSIDAENVVTKGDANNGADEPFPVNVIKGAVFMIVPKVGYVVWILKSPIGIAVTLAVALLLMEMSFQGERKQKDEEKELIKAEIRKLVQELQQDLGQESLSDTQKEE